MTFMEHYNVYEVELSRIQLKTSLKTLKFGYRRVRPRESLRACPQPGGHDDADGARAIPGAFTKYRGLLHQLKSFNVK